TQRQEPNTSALTTRKLTTKSISSKQVTTEFGKSLRSLLGKTAVSGQVNEEELFAATTHQLIKNRFGENLAKDFRSAFKLNMADKPDTERFSSAERAAKQSLRFFVDSTLMTKEDAQQIRTLATNLSQLGENDSKLWDSWGDTKATTSISRGQTLVQGRLEQTGNAPVTSSGKQQASVSTYSNTENATAPRSNRRSSRGDSGSVKRTA
ncbi:MAG: hypothetical protein ACK5Y6_02605, partial [Pseudomonadota bacterium]